MTHADSPLVVERRSAVMLGALAGQVKRLMLRGFLTDAALPFAGE